MRPTAGTEEWCGVQEEMDDAAFSPGTLEQLSAYFVLSNAEKSGFKVSDIPGLTQEQATKAAAVFAKYDKNEDYKLQLNELKMAIEDADFTLSDDEIKAGIAMMDKNQNGVIEFNEFATWWAAQPSSTSDP
jgi:Ca2+-binding EF-hand superfamily protein